MTDPTTCAGGPLSWQWGLYAQGHRDRRNLAFHAVTNPLFVAGTFATVAAPLVSDWLAAGGVAAMAVAMALQGRGLRGEQVAPVPFRGPLDVVARIFAEQLVTFSRCVASGAVARAWREAG